MRMRSRFAPSPTGFLHLGHAFSAMTVWQRTTEAGGEMLLRIEDIDRIRCTAAFETAICDDLHWLGLDWPTPVLRQSERCAAYDAALARLTDMGLTYPCRCTRGDIRAALAAPQEGAPRVASVYPGTCRDRPMSARGPADAIRLDTAKAMSRLAALPSFSETGPRHKGHHRLSPQRLRETIGDIVLARRDIATSYHLAVVVDDAAQGVTEIIRGEDLYAVTPVHVLLQALLDLPIPSYHHHRLIRDEAGRRLAKRDQARALRSWRAAGASPQDIRRQLGLQGG